MDAWLVHRAVFYVVCAPALCAKMVDLLAYSHLTGPALSNFVHGNRRVTVPLWTVWTADWLYGQKSCSVVGERVDGSTLCRHSANVFFLVIYKLPGI